MDPRLYAQLHEIEASHWWFRGRRQIILTALERFALGAGSVLDVGCGAGTNLDMLRERYPSGLLYGVDIEHEPLLYCAKDHALPVAQGDVARLPFADGSFDLVAALDTLEHFEDDDAALRELFRVCRPGGSLLVTVPAFRALWGSVDDLGHHHRRYDRKGLVERIQGAGFGVRQVRFFNFLLSPPIFVVRCLGRLRRKRQAREGEPVRSDLDIVKSGPLNEILARILAAEAWFDRAPFGVSLLCVAERPGSHPD